jgi:acyl carrier protein
MELPLGPTGKVDRKRLPTPEFGQEAKQYMAPRNHTEEIMCEVWSEVLGLERVGIHDNFFELGGHSILATQIMARIRDVFHVVLNVGVIFTRNTVADLALAVNEKSGPEDEAQRMKITPVDRKKHTA